MAGYVIAGDLDLPHFVVRTGFHKEFQVGFPALNAGIVDRNPGVEISALDIEGLQPRQVRLHRRLAIRRTHHVAVPDPRNRGNNALAFQCPQRARHVLGRKHGVAADVHVLHFHRIARLHVQQ